MTDAATTTSATDATASAAAAAAAAAASSGDSFIKPAAPAVTDAAAKASQDAIAAAAATAKTAADAAALAAAGKTVTRPEGIPEDYWDAATSAVKVDAVAKALKEANDAKVATEAAKAALPKTAAEYLPTLPADIKLPEGAKIDVNDPRFKALQELSLKSGKTQAEFTELLGIEARGVLAKADSLKRAVAARDTALGPNAAARVDALTAQFTATAESPQVARELSQVLWTPGIVAHMEKLYAAIGSQGVASLTRAKAGDGPTPGSIPGYEKMSFAEKMVASESLKAAGGGRG